MPYFTNRGIVPLPAGLVPGAEATAFLARANASTTLDSTHTDAYIELINGLVSDGVWAGLDVLYLYATDTSTHALLNLISTSYTGTLTGAPTFTADTGYTAGTSGIDYVQTNWNAFSAGGNYTLNQASMGGWAVVGSGTALSWGQNQGGNDSSAYSQYSDTKCYVRINDDPASAGFIVADGTGFVFGVRTSATARTAYKNGVSIGTYGSTPVASALWNDARGAIIGAEGAGQFACFVAGGNLDSLQSQLYTRLRDYMDAMGVP